GRLKCWTAKNCSLGVNGPSILRISSKRDVALGLLGLKPAGMSVKGTSVSPWASAGVAQSGTNASRLAAANPLLKVSLRVTCSGMVCLLALNDVPSDSLNVVFY